jgi:type I restriction enzyme S subunit
MIDGPRQYPAYRATKVPWLGMVPEHWSVRSLKRACSRWSLYGANIPASEYVATGVRFLRTTDLTTEGALRRAGVYVTPEAASGYVLSDGDVLISRSGTIGRSFRYRKSVDGVCSYAGYLVRYVAGRDLLPDYLFYFTKSASFDDFVRMSVVSSTIENLSGEKYAAMTLPIPPLHEQVAIVRVLGHVDGRIRRYIAGKKKLIALLNEQKQTIVHHAVARGLDPNVRLKPSGVEWLEDVPAHWGVVRVAAVADFLSGKAHEKFIDPDGEFVCVTARFVSTGGVHARNCTANFCPAQIGDVLMVMSDLPRGRALARAYHVSDDRKYAVNQRVCVLRAHSINSQFLAYCANRNPQLLAHDDGSNQTHLPNSAFKTLMVPIPPPEEQEAIVDALGSQVVAIDRAVARTRKEIELVAEYRTRLITDVVTGRLDVRQASALVPDEVEEAPPLDDTDDLEQGAEPEADADERPAEVVA